jgi:hypothetical protein
LGEDAGSAPRAVRDRPIATPTAAERGKLEAFLIFMKL